MVTEAYGKRKYLPKGKKSLILRPEQKGRDKAF
jgi:hypothetical protein